MNYTYLYISRSRITDFRKFFSRNPSADYLLLLAAPDFQTYLRPLMAPEARNQRLSLKLIIWLRKHLFLRKVIVFKLNCWVTWFNRQQHQILQIGIIIAHIGGVAALQTGDLGTKIDTYNVKTKIEKRGVAKMEYDRKQFSCALIPNGPFGNPTVAICKIIFMV